MIRYYFRRFANFRFLFSPMWNRFPNRGESRRGAGNLYESWRAYSVKREILQYKPVRDSPTRQCRNLKRSTSQRRDTPVDRFTRCIKSFHKFDFIFLPYNVTFQSYLSSQRRSSFRFVSIFFDCVHELYLTSVLTGHSARGSYFELKFPFINQSNHFLQLRVDKISS